MPGQVEDFRTVVARVRRDKGMTLEDVAFEARRHAAPGGSVSLSLIQKRLAPGSKRQPSAELLEAVAAGLGINPTEFVEWRLHKARESFDEDVVGLEQAVEHLEQLSALIASHLDDDHIAGLSNLRLLCVPHHAELQHPAEEMADAVEEAARAHGVETEPSGRGRGAKASKPGSAAGRSRSRRESA